MNGIGRVLRAAAIGAVLLLPPTLGWRSYHHARSAHATAIARYEQTEGDLHELRSLQVQQPTAEIAERPAQDVIEQVHFAMRTVGITPRQFESLNPAGDVAITNASSDSTGKGPLYRRQAFRVSLQGLTPSDLGRFLDAWRKAQPRWTPTDIELTRPRQLKTDAQTYDVRLVLSAIYAAQAEPRP